MRIRGLLAFLVLTALPAGAAEICNDINTIADGWHEVANYIDENQDEGISDEEGAALVELSEALGEGTGALAGALLQEGNAEEKAMGKKLERHITKLSRVDGDDEVNYLVEIIDDLVTTLDEVVAYCDSVN